MKTHSGNTSEGFIPATSTGNGSGGGGAAVAPSPEDPTATFADFLHKQQGPAKTSSTDGSFFSALTNAAPELTDPTAAPTTPAPTAPWTPAASDASTLAAMTAASLAAAAAAAATPAPSNAALGAKAGTLPQAPAAPEDDTAPATTLGTTPAPAAKPILARSDLSIMLARASLFASMRKEAPAGSAPAQTASTEAASTSADALESDTLAVETSASAASPLQAWGIKPAVPAPAEKKSGDTSPQRSFIQADASTSTSLSMALMASLAGAAGQHQPITNQPVTTHSATAAIGSANGSGTALASAGMANGKKENEMNATLDLTDLMVSSGAASATPHTSANVNILLGTNQDFHHALEQVMHVAELSNLSTSTPPLRVAIEIQTPPGAVVNLYVSRQADSYRAQLSTDDVQALAWVQDQIGTLKQSTELGTEVRWLPAQLESAAPSLSTSSSSSSSNNGQDLWNRGGQGWQQQQQQGDERQQARQKRPVFSPLLNPQVSIPFIGALGRAA